MARNASAGSTKRPFALSSKSFTRYEPSNPTSSRSRASTIQTPLVTSPRKSVEEDRDDLFNKPLVQEDEPLSPKVSRTSSLPDHFDELPIELASLTDRFVDSLSAKVYNEPPSVDQLSELFQEFYIRAASSISTHIAILLSRLNRSNSKSTSKAQSLSSQKSSDSLAPPDKTSGATHMLTASEVTDKRKARRLLEYKKILLEEAVERRACEKIYDKIWRHKSTLDEARDEKLRSKTSALALVGIGLKDLGIELDEKSSVSIEDVQESLAPAREGLSKMNEERCPLGKLQHLTDAHKVIVDTLYTLHGSSSSADEILPTLIYTLITSPIEGINIISNLYFIQRFRTASKIDGEAAYCLTNLEAAITFLEDVDLASLRADELPEGPRKMSSTSATPPNEKLVPFSNFPAPSLPSASSAIESTVSVAGATDTEGDSASAALQRAGRSTSLMGLPSPRHQRTLSDLLRPPTKILSTANVAVRNTAEEGFKNISDTLDNSFKFLFGKLKERSEENAHAELLVPKTLDEARQLVNKPLTPDADDALISETSSIAEKESVESASPLHHTKPDDKILSLFGNRKIDAARERSVDSLKSNSSSKRVAFAATGSAGDVSQTGPLKSSPSANTPANPLDQMKSLGNSLNPLSHIGSAFGRFGRPAAVSPSPPEEARPNPRSRQVPDSLLISPPSTETQAKLKLVLPIQRFINLSDAADLKIGDVAELLRDYQRLAKVVSDLAGEAPSDDVATA